MALSDPQTVTIDGTPVSLPNVARPGRSGIYESADGNLTLTISHVNGKRARSVVRLDRKKIVADPLIATTNRQVSWSVQFVIDQPLYGPTDAELTSDMDGLIGLVDNASFKARFVGGES